MLKKLLAFDSFRIKAVLGALGTIALFSFVYTNCGRMVLGSLAASSSSPSNGINSITVSSTSCPANEAPIGIDPSQNILCAPEQTSTSTSCPSGSSIYTLSGGDAVCVPNTGWNQPGSVCPVGQYLTGYTTAGAIACAAPTISAAAVPTPTPTPPPTPSPGATATPSPTATPQPSPTATPISYTCPVGSYLNSIVGGVAVCLPVAIPSAMVCPTGQMLYDINSTGPVCIPDPWLTTTTTQSCPSGNFALGWLNGNLLCQQNVFPSGPVATCPAGQILTSDVAGTVVCSPPPNPDLSHACMPGLNVSKISSGMINCQTAGVGGGPQCASGQFVIGLAGGQPVCAGVAINKLPQSCPNESYPIGISNGAVVCVPFANLINPTPTQICYPNAQTICAVVGGVGSQTCSSDGTTLSTCTAVNCNAGYTLGGGACTADPCNPGSQQSCQIANGTGNQFCGTTGAWGACQVQSCNNGYFNTMNTCTAMTCTPSSITTCAIGYGFGYQACLPNGSGYGSCLITSCQNGFTLKNQTCVDTTPPVVSFAIVPANPTLGPNASLTFSAIDTLSSLTSVNCQLDSAVYTPCTSPVSLTGLSNGAHTFTVTASDQAGNSASATATWVNDICSPGSTNTCMVLGGTGVETCSSSGVYGTCIATLCSSGYTLANGSCQALNCNPGYTAVGNTCVDQTVPTINVVTQPTDPTLSKSATATFTVTDSGSGVASVTCMYDKNKAQTCTTSWSDSSICYGAHTLVITAIDQAGNTASKTLSWHNFACAPGAVETCGICNGGGQQTCLATGTGYGSCVPTTCNSGYKATSCGCIFDYWNDGSRDDDFRKANHK